MIGSWLNWRTLFALIAIAIVTGTIFYSNYLASKIAKEEVRKVEAWIEAQQTLLNTTDTANITLASKLIAENNDIPIIETNEADSITNYRNIDLRQIERDGHFLMRKLSEFKALHAPVVLVLNRDPYIANKYYFGESRLQKEVRYYPIIQLVVVGLFIVITFSFLRMSHRSSQNQIWAGMAKETAHQLGTPLTSLEGWIEMLKDNKEGAHIAVEMQKDLQRLQLVSDRFGKIGSKPKLEETDVVQQIENMVDYVKKRAGKMVGFSIRNSGTSAVIALISPPLFDWVMENLLKNALDAMEGKGSITIDIYDRPKQVIIDVSDTGKGISKANLRKVFAPGFTTKKRGWGLGLTLTKRIIHEYHQGNIFVKHSEIGQGTTFRIVLEK